MTEYGSALLFRMLLGAFLGLALLPGSAYALQSKRPDIGCAARRSG